MMNVVKVFSVVKNSHLGSKAVLNCVNCRCKSSSSDGDKTQAVDFVQQLFLDKIREYDQKKKESGGKMFDPIDELEKERSRLQEVLIKTFYKMGKPPADITAFPKFDFKDLPLDPIDLVVEDPAKKKKK
uniref:ATP synthase-coupling factor 6, mitochondrial n=1 Tax=Lygus hesperus TaxID=30085 RepID=A0A0A9XSU3_LYGHE